MKDKPYLGHHGLIVLSTAIAFFFIAELAYVGAIALI